MLLSFILHIVAALALAVMSALTLHFILLMPLLTGGITGLLLYLLFVVLAWNVTDRNLEV